MRETLVAARAMVGLALRADLRGAAFMLALRILGAVASTAFAWFSKLVIDGVVSADLEKVTVSGVLVAVTVAVAQLAGNVAFRSRIRLEENMSLLLDRELISLAAGVPGIEHHERPDYLKELELLSDSRIALSQTAGSMFEIVAVIVRATGTVLLLGALHPLLLLLPLFAVPSLWTARRAQLLRAQAQDDRAEDARLGAELFDIATTATPAKELRLFRLEREVLDRHRKTWEKAYDAMFEAQRRGAVLTTLGWLFFTTGYTLAIVFVALRAVAGNLTVGDVFLAMNLAGQVNTQVAQFVSTYSWSVFTLKSAKRYVWLRDYVREATADVGSATSRPVPSRLEHGISFEDVTFRYPETDAAILEDVNLHLPAGATVALVGENGAGKTTLIKLLCRFYEPTEGVIRVDGTDLSRLDFDEWRERMSAGFQDFARFELVAQEAIGIGYLPDRKDGAATVDALRRAGAPEVVNQLPSGLATQLGKSFEGGAELSMGQWQKLALGRTMMRQQPLVLILDEPTASLDAPTEHALFERYAETARELAAKIGAITVLVSHRFSTVRMADLIVVIDEGHVVEVGTHAELMVANGLYAELYELQARAYR